MKNIIRIAVVAVAVVVALAIGKDVMAKAAVQGILKTVTGLQLAIGRFSLGILSTMVDIRDIRLMNPRGFRDRVMMDAPQIKVDYDLGSVFRGEIHVEEMALDLKEFTVVKNERGEVNVNALKPAGKKEEPKAAPQKEAAAPAEKKPGPKMRIDVLRLKIGKVVYKDYSQGGEPVVTEYPVNIDETHRDITNPSALVGLITAKALMNTTIARVANLDMDQIMSEFDFTGMNMQDVGLGQFQDLVGGTGTGIRQKAAEALQSLSNMIGGSQ
jgi:uncharacterized protein involved in outer membrane biogenesis